MSLFSVRINLQIIKFYHFEFILMDLTLLSVKYLEQMIKWSMVGYYQGKNKATRNSFKANATHVWTVKNGKLSRFFQAVDTATINS